MSEWNNQDSSLISAMTTWSRLGIFLRSCSGSEHIPSAANKDGSLKVTAGIEGPVRVEVVAMIGAAGITVAGRGAWLLLEGLAVFVS